MSVKQQFHELRSSQSSSVAGDTISPSIRPVPASAPIQLSRRDGTEGVVSSATGFPNRVIRTGFFVLRTRSSTARHVALNLEMAIRSIGWVISWSKTMVNYANRLQRCFGHPSGSQVFLGNGLAFHCNPGMVSRILGWNRKLGK
jgi:hypothetical protein